MGISYILVLGVIVHVACQVYKVVYYSIRDKKFSPHMLLSAGGMPSTHSAFTTTIALSLGLTYGFASEYFTIAFTFTAIVIYDSLRLRGAVQTLAEVVAGMADKKTRDRIPLRVGHTFAEIVIGIGFAIVVSVAGYLVRPALGV